MDFYKININYFVFCILFIYFPFHLLEEALGNFPHWMYKHKWIPEEITFSHWMANNIFFYFFLLQIGFILSVVFHSLSFFGIGIIFWGLINFFDHFIYSIIDHKKSPGIFTGILYLVMSIFGLINAYKSNLFTIFTLSFSIFMGFIYAFLPVAFSMLFHKTFNKIFK